MKKVMSFMLCLCIVIGMSAFAVSAEVAVAEIKDGAVIEFEDYGGEENKNFFVFTSDTEGVPSKPYGGVIASDYINEDGIGLSGGAVLGLAERTGATGMTFTIPVSVTEPGLYDVEWYGTDGGVKGEYLSRYTVSADDSAFTVAGNSTLYFRPDANLIKGDGADLSQYPIKCCKAQLYLTEDTENVVITATPNTNGTSSGLGIKMVLDCVKFKKAKIPTASWDAEAVIEMEDFIPNVRYTFPEGKTNAATYLAEAKASGGAVMNMEEKGNIQAMEFDIPVKIEADGWYIINLVASTSNKSDTSVLYIKDGDDEWVNNWQSSGYAGSQLLYFGTEESHKHYGVYDHKTAKYLKAGEYTLNASAVAITSNSNATKFIADCLVISPSKTKIPAEGKRVEIEDYRTLFSRAPGRQTNKETGETFLSDLGGRTTEFTTTFEFEKSGYYDVSFHGTPWNNNGLSKINFYLGDDLLMDNNNTANYGVDEGYLFSQYLPAWMFTKERVYIEAGSYPFKMEIIERIPERPDVLCAHASDYLEFKKVQLPEISETGTTALEMEDLVPYIKYTFDGEGTSSASVVKEAKASGGAVMDMAERHHVAAVEFDIPFTVKKSGWYNLNLVASSSNKSDTSVLYIKDGEDEWINNWEYSGYAGKNQLFFGEEGSAFRWYSVYDHETSRYIEAGEYRLKASAVSITNQSNATKFVADCLKFTPVEISLPENDVFELENMKSFFMPWKPSSGVADGNASVSMLHTYSGQDIKAVIPVNFPESGYYNVTFLGTPWLNNGLSKINITMDGDLLMNNDETKSGVALDYNYRQFLPAYEFKKQFVYIEAGVHEVTIEAFMRNPDPTKNNECAFGMDSLAFVPVTDEAILNADSKTVSVTGLYEASVSGKFIAAAYCGKEMVGITSFDDTDLVIFDADVSYTGTQAPDTVKIFVWEDLDNVVPVETVKVITVK